MAQKQPRVSLQETALEFVSCWCLVSEIGSEKHIAFIPFFSGCSRDFLGEENGASRFVRCICAVGSCRKWSRKQAGLPAPHRCVTFLLMAQISTVGVQRMPFPNMGSSELGTQHEVSKKDL